MKPVTSRKPWKERACNKCSNLTKRLSKIIIKTSAGTSKRFAFIGCRASARRETIVPSFMFTTKKNFPFANTTMKMANVKKEKAVFTNTSSQNSIMDPIITPI